ncbi:MAG: HNH endonuclease, partial [Pirellulales bacterium]
KNGRIEPSVEVHHIVPLSVDPTLKYELTNIVALCKGCHSLRHKNLRSGDAPPSSQRPPAVYEKKK